MMYKNNTLLLKSKKIDILFRNLASPFPLISDKKNLRMPKWSEVYSEFMEQESVPMGIY